MSRTWVLIFIFFLALMSRTVQATAGDIDRLLELPEEKIDIGIAALTFAKEVYPDLDIKAYSAKIDKMVKEVKILTKGRKSPDFRVRALNTYFYLKMGIRYDLAEDAIGNPSNRYINGIIDTKKGTCITMPLLYMAIAQRLGYPVYPVTTPDHYFLRYVDRNFKEQNIEVTGKGAYVPDKQLAIELEVPPKAIASGCYLRTLSYHEYLANLLSINAVHWSYEGDYEKSIKYMKKAILINPSDANAYQTLADIYIRRARLMSPYTAIQMLIEANINYITAYDLGFIFPSQNNIVRKQKN